MGNNLLASNELYTNVKSADSIYTIPILSAVRRVLELKAEIERDVLELEGKLNE